MRCKKYLLLDWYLRTALLIPGSHDLLHEVECQHMSWVSWSASGMEERRRPKRHSWMYLSLRFLQLKIATALTMFDAWLLCQSTFDFMTHVCAYLQKRFPISSEAIRLGFSREGCPFSISTASPARLASSEEIASEKLESSRCHLIMECCWFFLTGYHWGALPGLELTEDLLLPPKCWHYMHILLVTLSCLFFFFILFLIL